MKSTLQIPVDGYTVLKESTNGYLWKPNIQHGIWNISRWLSAGIQLSAD